MRGWVRGKEADFCNGRPQTAETQKKGTKLKQQEERSIDGVTQVTHRMFKGKDDPGLAVAKTFRDLRFKDYGVIAIPEAEVKADRGRC